VGIGPVTDGASRPAATQDKGAPSSAAELPATGSAPAHEKGELALASTAAGARGRRVETAESMARQQREISVSEFFSKNRHLLGFDNPRKALLTAVKEAVDNSLDACEEAAILPDLDIEIRDLGNDRFRVLIRDNGPGIVRGQIPNIFGKLLYGSKFHRLKMSRGQQGIGISAAGMYGQLTTGKGILVITRTSPRKPAQFMDLRIDTKKNRPEILREGEVVWESDHGTEVTLELSGKYQRGRQSVDEYVRQTAVANPHVRIRYRAPDGAVTLFDRSTDQLPPPVEAIKPHPHGVELGVLQVMLKDSHARSLQAFLQQEFSRVSARVAEQICEKAALSPRAYVSRVNRNQVEQLLKGIAETKIMAPPTNCVAPIGEAQLIKGLESVVPAAFYASTTRPPAVYRGNPFIIEAALAYGGEGQEGDQPARLFRFANRVPLLYQQGGCCSALAATHVNWKNYGVQQPRGSLPVGPLTIVVHMASVWVPFTSESKEAIASYPEIEEEMTLALQECGRKLRIFLSRKKRDAEQDRKRNYIQIYLPHIGVGLKDLVGLSEDEEEQVVRTLETLLERARD
jgi:DNA topoisomerase-6 subunit B